MKQRVFYRPVNRSPAEDRTFDGVVYDSKAECKRAGELAALVQAGVHRKVERQVKFQLGPDFATKVDFVVTTTIGLRWVEEVKGFEKPRFRDVRRLWKKYGPMPMLVMVPKGTGWKTERVEGKAGK